MTEAEWLAYSIPTPMLEYLRDNASNRKLRLYACAAFQCRGFDWTAISPVDQEAQETLAIGERYADSQITVQELEAASTRSSFLVLLKPEAWVAAYQSCRSTINLSCRKGEPAVHEMQTRLALLLRDIIGNPFCPVTINPAWLEPNVVALAKTIYDERAFDRLPLLADALVTAGCDNQDILSHCRSEGPHVRGCWSVDLVLGQE